MHTTKRALVWAFAWLVTLIGCAAPIEPAPARIETSEAKILVVVTSADTLIDGTPGGYYLPELVDFYEVVNAAGIAIDIASPRGGKAPMHDRPIELSGRKESAFLEQTGLLADLDGTIALADIDPKSYRAVYYVGGFAAMMDFSSDPRVAAVGAKIYEAGGVIAAVCHGPTALVNLKLSSGEYLVRGKKITSRTASEDRDNAGLPFVLEHALRKRGAVYERGQPGTPHVEEDERLITGQRPTDAKLVAERVVAKLAAQ